MIFLMMMLVMAGAGCSSDDETEMKPQAGGKVELTVYAAVSLQDTLNDIKKSLEKENANVEVRYNFGASGRSSSNRYGLKEHLLTCFSQRAEDKFDGRNCRGRSY